MGSKSTKAPEINGILETPVYVDDFERAHAFYGGCLGLKRILAAERLWTYEVRPGQFLLIFLRGACQHDAETSGGLVPGHNSEGPAHFAFAIAKDRLDAWREHLIENDVAIISEVTWPAGGISLYFADPDGNIVELATPGLWPGY